MGCCFLWGSQSPCQATPLSNQWKDWMEHPTPTKPPNDGLIMLGSHQFYRAYAILYCNHGNQLVAVVVKSGTTRVGRGVNPVKKGANQRIMGRFRSISRSWCAELSITLTPVQRKIIDWGVIHVTKLKSSSHYRAQHLTTIHSRGYANPTLEDQLLGINRANRNQNQ